MVVVGGGLVVVVVLCAVVVVVGGGSAGDVVVVGAGGLAVVDAAALGPDVWTSDTVAGGGTARCDVRVVVVTAGPDAPEVVVDGALGAGGAAAASVFGPTVGTGPTRCRACAGSRGVEPPGANATRTASRSPTAASPANMPARCERGPSSGGASANSRCSGCPTSPVAPAAPASPGWGPVPSSSMSIRSTSAGGAGGSHQRKPRVARKLASASVGGRRADPASPLTGPRRDARP